MLRHCGPLSDRGQCKDDRRRWGVQSWEAGNTMLLNVESSAQRGVRQVHLLIVFHRREFFNSLLNEFIYRFFNMNNILARRRRRRRREMSTEKKLTNLRTTFELIYFERTACSLKLYFQLQSDEKHLRGDISSKTTPEKRQKTSKTSWLQLNHHLDKMGGSNA